MRTIAKGLVARKPATTNRDDRAPHQSIGIASRVVDIEIAFYAERAVFKDGEFYFFHDNCLLGDTDQISCKISTGKNSQFGGLFCNGFLAYIPFLLKSDRIVDPARVEYE